MSTANLPAISERSRPPAIQGDIVRSIGEAYELGQILVTSGMLPSGIRTPESAVAIILKGKELGIPPMEAFAGITVIQGKPTVSPQLMLSLIYRSKEIQGMPKITDDGKCCTVVMQRKGGDPHSESFSMEDAKGLGLSGKDNWIKQPKTMRKWRAIAACARVVFPDIIGGMYLHEEMGAVVTEEGEIIEGAPYQPTPEAPKAIPQNNSGHGRGQYASPEEAEEFRKRFDDWLQEQNAKWADRWSDDQGQVHPDCKELMNSWQARTHMLKWCVSTERLDPAIVPENTKNRQLDPYLAIAYFADAKAFGKEMVAYVTKKASELEDAFWRKHPDIAPPEWTEAQQHTEPTEPRPERKKKSTKKELAEGVVVEAEVVPTPETPWEEGRQ